jgi:phage terminase large subunit-like protein
VAERRPVSLLDAVSSARLLGASFKPRPLQRELLAAVDAGPRVQAVRFGRRGGKSLTAAAAAVGNACLRPDLDARMREGETRYVLAVATRLDQAALLIDYARELVRSSPPLAALLSQSSADELCFDLPGRHRSVIKAMPCTARGSRGWNVSMLVCDELAHFLDSEGNSSGEAVLTALLPSLAQFGDDGRVILISTPSGDRGVFYDYCTNGESGAWPWVRAHHATSKQANPELSDSLLEEERQRDPDGFRSEYLAEFVAGGAAFIELEHVLISDRGELPPDACSEWFAGVDPGFVRDPTAVVLVGRDRHDPDRLRLGLAHALAPRRSVSFEDRRAVEDERLATVARLLRDYGVSATLADQYASAPIVDRMRRLGVEVTPYALSQETKAAAFRELRTRLYDGTLELFEHRQLLGELRRLGFRQTPRGLAITTPRAGDSHCDLAIALALATEAAKAEVEAVAIQTIPPAVSYGYGSFG